MEKLLNTVLLITNISFLITSFLFSCKQKQSNQGEFDQRDFSSKFCATYYDSCFERDIYNVEGLDVIPQFNQGASDLYSYVAERLKFTDIEFSENDGKLELAFIIEATGDIDCVRAKDCFKSLNNLEHKLKKIIKDMPKWRPGKCNGQTVPVRYNFLMTF